MKFTTNKSVQILVSLLKRHGITKAVISPGATNLECAAALQEDGSFELFASVDERSAAYIACGMAQESGEPVVIVCTESTASRNYFPGLTEAYYRKLPILAVTGVHDYYKTGQLEPQIIDRGISPSDTVKRKYQLPIIKDESDEQFTVRKVNEALLELKRESIGPVHIDLPCSGVTYDFSASSIPDFKKINRFFAWDELPSMPKGRVAVFMSSCLNMKSETVELIDRFCGIYNGVVFCDPTCGYRGKYAVYTGLIGAQAISGKLFGDIDLLIHIGEGYADEPTVGKLKKSVKSVWRVSGDGEIRDTFKKLDCVFEMPPELFFKSYVKDRSAEAGRDEYLKLCRAETASVAEKIKEIPYSNVYFADRLMERIPEDGVIYLGPSNTIRAWTFFGYKCKARIYANVGCRGIDGTISTAIGGALAVPDKLHFCVLGDLSFFYDMNSLGNRYFPSNLRILIINNNGGGVFKLEGAPGHRFFGDEFTNKFIAAENHFGKSSRTLVKGIAESLGMEYISAENKSEFDGNVERFISNDAAKKPIVFETFTTADDDREAFAYINSLNGAAVSGFKKIIKNTLGDKNTEALKKLFKK